MVAQSLDSAVYRRFVPNPLPISQSPLTRNRNGKREGIVVTRVTGDRIPVSILAEGQPNYPTKNSRFKIDLSAYLSYSNAVRKLAAQWVERNE